MPDLLGTVAGDDTILLIIKEGASREQVIESLSSVIPSIKE
jgi:transcriptional regulator of arginine metabolism